MGLAQAIKGSANTYGVLLVSYSSSRTVVDDLRHDISRIGMGRNDDLKNVTTEFVKFLNNKGFSPLEICSKLSIVARDFHLGSEGESGTITTIEKFVVSNQTAAARSVLVRDGVDVIQQRGQRNSQAIIDKLVQDGIQLQVTPSNLQVDLSRYSKWLMEINANFLIQVLNLRMPVTAANLSLRLMDSDKEPNNFGRLSKNLKEYHEWHRLTNDRSWRDTTDIFRAFLQSPKMIVVGGPGSGKSTLLRHIAYYFSERGEGVLKVSLRQVSQLFQQGKSFDESLVISSCDGFRFGVVNFAANIQILLADGLDEADPNRASIANLLDKWVMANPTRKAIITTRPVGHYSSWFTEWQHWEVMPLSSDEIKSVVDVVEEQRQKTTSSLSSLDKEAFLQQVQASPVSQVGAKSPQLLTFILALYLSGKDISGSRYQLLIRIIRLVRDHPIDDRIYPADVDKSFLQTVICHLGWILQNKQLLDSEDIVDEVLRSMPNDLAHSYVTRQVVESCFRLWESYGLIERVSAGIESTWTFIHLSLQSVCAAQYLAQQSESLISDWVIEHHNDPKNLDTLTLLGGTSVASLVIETLLASGDPADPINTSAFRAADLIAESSSPDSNIQELTLTALEGHISSNVPSVAYKVGRALTPLAKINPAIVSSVAKGLLNHGQIWTRMVASQLLLASGDIYVDKVALLATLESFCENPMRYKIESSRFRLTDFMYVQILLDAFTYILNQPDREKHLPLLLRVYKSKKFGSYGAEQLGAQIRPFLTNAQWKELDPQASNGLNWNLLSTAVDAALRFFLETLYQACNRLCEDTSRWIADPLLASIAKLWWLLDIDSQLEFTDLPYTIKESALVELLTGIIKLTGVSPDQLKADLEEVIGKLGKGYFSLTAQFPKPKLLPDQVPVNWSNVDFLLLNQELIVEGMYCPVFFVVNWATEFAARLPDKTAIDAKFRDVLLHAEGYALPCVADLGGTVWPKNEWLNLMSTRIRTKPSEHCEHVLKTITDNRSFLSSLEFTGLIRSALESKIASLVSTAVEIIDKLEIIDEVAIDVRTVYAYWSLNGPMYPEGGGVVSENPAAKLLAISAKNRLVQYDDLIAALQVKRRDCHDVVYDILCNWLPKGFVTFEMIIVDLQNGRLSSLFLSKLSHSERGFCYQNREIITDWIKQVIINNVQYDRGIAIQLLCDGWIDSATTENILRPLLESADVALRQAAYDGLGQIAKSANL